MVVQVKEPLDIIHEIVEDDTIKASHKILYQEVNIISKKAECLSPGRIMRHDVNSPRRQTSDL